MSPSSFLVNSVVCTALILLEIMTRVSAGSQFSSHVTVNTPSLSFSHGVGDPLSAYGRRSLQRQVQRNSYRKLRKPFSPQSFPSEGYILPKPSIPFYNEDILPRPYAKSMNSPWAQSNIEVPIPLLPPSPYKVDSDDPESLWPEGLFVPPIRPSRYGSNFGRRADTDPKYMDPYLLEGSEAVAAVAKADFVGRLYFEDFPHINSLLANQNLRVKNKLKPHRIASIRLTWPFNRP